MRAWTVDGVVSRQLVEIGLHRFLSSPALKACNKTPNRYPAGGCLHADHSTLADYSGVVAYGARIASPSVRFLPGSPAPAGHRSATYGSSPECDGARLESPCGLPPINA